MPLPANLFWTHPQGDSTVVPCVHLVQQHPAGDAHNIPCLHLVQEHPEGDPNPIPGLPNVPCTHIHQEHPKGDEFVTPCIHLMQAHPAGDPGPDVPCIHQITPAAKDTARHLIFYTDDTTYQSIVTTLVDKLLDQLQVRNVG